MSAQEKCLTHEQVRSMAKKFRDEQDLLNRYVVISEARQAIRDAQFEVYGTIAGILEGTLDDKATDDANTGEKR